MKVNKKIIGKEGQIKEINNVLIALILIVAISGIVLALQAQPGGQTELRVQSCTGEDGAASNSFAGACDGTYPAACGAAPTGDLLSCNDGNSEIHTASSTSYGGINISQFNSSISDCTEVQQVSLCYEWWGATGLAPTACRIDIDNQKGTNYTTIVSTCPGTSANPGVICTNVTSNKTWTCANFFGASGNRSNIRTELTRSVGGNKDVFWDALFFNVTYSVNVSDTIPPNVQFVSPTSASEIYASRNYIEINVTASDEIALSAIVIRLFNSTQAQINSSTSATSPNYINFSGLSEGIYFYNATANDTSNNVNTTETRNITLDRTNPLIDYGVGTENSGVNVSRNWIYVNVTVTETNEANITFRLFNTTGLVNSTTFTTAIRTINFTGLSDGTYTYNVTIVDLASNGNTTATRTITLDTTAPQIQFVSPTETSGSTISRNNTLINVTANDALLANITIRLFNSTALINETTVTTSPNFVNIDNLPNGIYFFNATAYDSLVHFNNTETRNVTIDSAEVIISFVNPTPANNSAQSPTSVTINATVTNGLSGIDKCILEFDGINQSMTKVGSGSSVTCNATKTGLAEGQHNFTLFANSSIGIVGSSSRIFIVDTIIPTINFTNPTLASGVFRNQNYIEINVTANDTNLANVTIRLYNSTNNLINSVIDGSPFYVNFSGLAEGIYYYNASVNDTAGNTNNTETRTIFLDTTAPNGTILAPQNASYTNVTSQNFTLNLTDNLGLANATLNIYNASGLYNRTTITFVGGPLQATVGIVVSLIDGIYNWFWEIVDLANNQANTQTTVGNETITIDTISPAITIISPLNQTYNSTDNILLNFTATDSSGISNCWYSLNAGANISLPGCNSILFNATAGSNNIIVYANDSAGNINSTQRFFSALYNTSIDLT